MKTRLKPVYFENQRQAASLLGLDEYDLKEWKADGCPAFKYGRIYHAELLEWIEAKAQKANPSDGAKGRRFAIGELMFALAKAYEADAITHEQYFEQTTALVTALGEKEVTTAWIQNNSPLAQNISVGSQGNIDVVGGGTGTQAWIQSLGGNQFAVKLQVGLIL